MMGRIRTPGMWICVYRATVQRLAHCCYRKQDWDKFFKGVVKGAIRIVHYWNQANFEGLEELSAELRARDDLCQLADYCELRGSGLRGEAFAALRAFLRSTKRWTQAQAQLAVDDILTLHFRTRRCHQFLTQPLTEELVFPVLRLWAENEPGTIVPIRWLGILKRNPEQLRIVLAANPSDIEVRRLLVERHLSEVDHASHHLGESLFIGELDEALKELGRPTDLIEGAPDRERLIDLEHEAREFGQMLFDWRAYKAKPEGSFPEWCSAKGRTYSWPAPVYYVRAT